MILPVSVLEVQHEGGQIIIKIGNSRFAVAQHIGDLQPPTQCTRINQNLLSFLSKLSSPSLYASLILKRHWAITYYFYVPTFFIFKKIYRLWYKSKQTFFEIKRLHCNNCPSWSDRQCRKQNFARWRKTMTNWRNNLKFSAYRSQMLVNRKFWEGQDW